LRGQTVAPAAEPFAEEQERITVRLAGLDGADQQRKTEQDDIAPQFEQVAKFLSVIDLDQLWAAATFAQRNALLDEYVKVVNVYRPVSSKSK
jgi:hypothetical protein